MDEFTKFVLGLASIGVSGFVAWTVGSLMRVRTEVSNLKQYVSDTYVKETDLAAFKSDIRDGMEKLDKELRDLSRLMHSVAGRLGVGQETHS